MHGKLILSYLHFINTSFFILDWRKTTKHSVRITQIRPPTARQQCIIFLFSSVWPLFLGTSCSSSEVHDVFLAKRLLFQCFAFWLHPYGLWVFRLVFVSVDSVSRLFVSAAAGSSSVCSKSDLPSTQTLCCFQLTVCEQHEKLQLLHH